MVQGGPEQWNGVSFTVTATYSDGTVSPASAPSNAITTTGGVSPYVYVNGQFYWEGDYSYGGQALNYTDTTGKPANGTYDVMWTAEPSAGGWQPYSPGKNFDTSAYRYIYVDLKPTRSGQTFGMSFALVGDVAATGPYGGAVTLPSDANGTYGPVPQVGVWATYKIPLVYMNVGAGSPNLNIYKFQIWSTTYYADNVYFSAN
jgi:hypothetical protein